MDLYDIGQAFAEIEAELIASMIRNMKRHRAEETKEGFEWTQWQAQQLKALEAYKKANKKKYGKKFRSINNMLAEAIKEARAQGNMDQEIEILEALRKGFARYSKANADVLGEFFKLNDRKLDALIKATKEDFAKGEQAILRMVEDQYRQIIFNVQVYANTGAGTYEKAVDMATKDFLERGINCIEYSNGARHTMSDYADMAIRTAAKRAYLAGEGEKRMEWGISLVIVNKRGNPCPKCLPFVGKILIDDVYSGGSKEDGNYPLLSRAMELGLYHPRCKDSHSTYFEGISTPPDDHFTEKDIEEIKDGYTDEQKRNVAQHNYQKYSRMAQHSLDKENQQKYTARAEYWKGEYKKYYNQSYQNRHQIQNDKNQFERYRKIIGDAAPATLEDFVKIKYNDSEKWEYYRGLKNYLSKYPTSDKRFYDVYYRLKEAGIKQGIVLPAKNVQAFILPEGKRDPYHIMHRMLERLVTDDDIRSFMTNAKCMFIQWNGNRRVYYSEKGACVVTKSDNDWLFKTAWSRSDYDDTTDTIMEVINKYV